MKHALLVAFLLAIGCGKPPAPPVEKEKPDPAVLALAESLKLDAEPAGALAVSAAKKSAKDGESVVVAGQVGGVAKPFIEGRASFVFVDASFTPSECDCPWDFCETKNKEEGMATVKFVGGDGQTLRAGARELFGLKELSQVVVKGKASRDGKGNLTILATGLHVRKGAQ